MLLVLNAPLLRIRMQPLLVLSIQCASYHSVFLALSLIFIVFHFFFYSFWRNCAVVHCTWHLEYRLCSCDSLAAYIHMYKWREPMWWGRIKWQFISCTMLIKPNCVLFVYKTARITAQYALGSMTMNYILHDSCNTFQHLHDHYR